MKYFEVNKKPQVDIDHKIGCLTVCSKPYYKYPASSNKHRRQFFDCVCDCGKIRGLLYNQCNIGIGSFKDNISLMENAIKYILNSK